MQDKYPNEAYILSLIGGIFVLIGAIVVTLAGAALTFFLLGIGAIIGVFGLIWGIVLIYFAGKLKSDPAGHTTYGALIVVFSLLSWFGSYGGLVIGFLLCLIGGIMAIALESSADFTFSSICNFNSQ
ncbi:MAG: DUF6114 domain-containing protein [Conexivisphaerales archaeon]